MSFKIFPRLITLCKSVSVKGYAMQKPVDFSIMYQILTHKFKNQIDVFVIIRFDDVV